MRDEIVIGLYLDPDLSELVIKTEKGIYKLWFGGYRKLTPAMSGYLREITGLAINGLQIVCIKFGIENAVLQFTTGEFVDIGLSFFLDPAGHAEYEILHIKDIDTDPEYIDWFENDLSEGVCKD